MLDNLTRASQQEAVELVEGHQLQLKEERSSKQRLAILNLLRGTVSRDLVRRASSSLIIWRMRLDFMAQTRRTNAYEGLARLSLRLGKVENKSLLRATTATMRRGLFEDREAGRIFSEKKNSMSRLGGLLRVWALEGSWGAFDRWHLNVQGQRRGIETLCSTARAWGRKEGANSLMRALRNWNVNQTRRMSSKHRKMDDLQAQMTAIQSELASKTKLPVTERPITARISPLHRKRNQGCEVFEETPVPSQDLRSPEAEKLLGRAKIAVPKSQVRTKSFVA